jgi:hypothetical protein
MRVRRLFTAAESGLSRKALRWGEQCGRWRRIDEQVYGDGPDDPTPMDRERARVLACGGCARGRLGAVLLGLDGVWYAPGPRRHRHLPAARRTEVDGFPCADALQVLIDLAPVLTDDVWEQAMESALRLGLTTVEAIEAAIPWLGAARQPGTRRVRRVMDRRPVGAPPTESLLETIGMQLARDVPLLGEPIRQHEVFTPDGLFVARLDLTFPRVGVFFELDGQQHAGQPVYDARRQTAVVACTGMLPGRFTWYELTEIPRATQRRMVELAEQGAARWTEPRLRAPNGPDLAARRPGSGPSATRKRRTG